MRKIIYPGTFDPIHNGHIDIATRAAKLFDELEFVVAVNTEKTPLFSIETRLELIRNSVQHIKKIKVRQPFNSSYDNSYNRHLDDRNGRNERNERK